MDTIHASRCFVRPAATLAIVAAAFGLSVANLRAQAPAGAPPPPPTAAAMKGKTAGEYYKKIEVLKDIPAEQVHPAMEYITVALGVGCGYCHVIPHFDQDDKREKHVARSMMAMTMAVDNTVFSARRELTCYTCHRGQAKPSNTEVLPGDKAPAEATADDVYPSLAIKSITDLDPRMSPSLAPQTVPVPGQSAVAKPAAAPVSLPSVDEVFSKYEQALGGSSAIEKTKSLSYTGSADMMVPPPPGPPGTRPAPPAPGTVPAEHLVEAPKGMLSVALPGRGPAAVGFDGTIGWHMNPTREDTGDELRMDRELGETIPALHFREDHDNVQVDALEKIGDRDTYRVVGTRKEGFPVIDRINFDAQSGLLVRSYTTMQSVIGGFPEDTYYEDYRDVSGLKVPHTVRVVSAEGNRTYKWSKIEANASIEDSKFAKPAPPPPRPAAD